MEQSEGTKKESPQYDPKRIEQEILDYWQTNNIFEKSISTKSESNPYRFYDGPPFITGLPHYGSLLSSIVKDIITRYQTQKGKRIDRVWGWDCHGIYVEQKVQEKLGYTSNKDIEQKGIEGFINGCYDFTKDVSDQWERYVDHLGRWVDFKNAYKTMDNDYMESVMWVFKSLWDKGLIYKGKRVSLYSTKLNTPISNYEVALDNSYADVSDPAITVKFPVNGSSAMQEEKDRFEKTQDGFVKSVFAVIKDEKGRYLSIYNSKRDMRQFPGGKVDIGETPEQALQRELKEELGVESVVGAFLGTRKAIMYGKTWLGHFYEVTIEGTPVAQETKIHTALGYAEITPSENNSLGYSYSIDGILIDDALEIMRFPALYALQSVIKKLPGDSAPIPYSFIAWTTTPWTIPANMALVVHPDLRYLQLFDIQSQEYIVLAESLVEKYYKNVEEYVIVHRVRGRELLGVTYQPPFDFYTTKGSQNHKVYAAEYVTDTDGTGIVHTAPEFGEEDFQTGLKNNLFQTTALDLEGKYTEEVPMYQGVYYRDANDVIMKDLKEKGVLVKKESVTHSVAMCPRTGVPLIYKAQDAWFINIQAVKEKLFENNEKIQWVPEHLKHGRFLKSMEGAPDRCISRTRFRATPMPVWKAEDNDMLVVGSLSEIYDLDQTGSKQLEKKEINGKVVYRDTKRDNEFDLHRPYVDDIWGMKDGKKYTRIPEVLDPWLESGSMPYAQVHYPFENKEKFEASFPADYVAEYVGQVRAWFFFMHAIAGMLSMPAKLEGNVLVEDKPVLPLPKAKYDSPAFTNVVCTGVLMGNDGRKMSKSFGNYPDPKETMENLGGDALRLYLASSPIVVGGDMNFTEEGLREVYKKMILPLWNSYYFYTTYATIDGFVPSEYRSIHALRHDHLTEFENPLDRWMIIKTSQLVNSIDKSLGEYNMQEGGQSLIRFMDDLTNWYIRRSRRRFWETGFGDAMGKDKHDAYTILYNVLATFCLISAPYTPFLAEHIFRKLTSKESVHLEEIISDRRDDDMSQSDLAMLRDMYLTQDIVTLGLSLRGQKKIRVKQPLAAVIVSQDIPQMYKDMVLEELNVKEFIVDLSMQEKVRKIYKPNAKMLGKKFGKDMQAIITHAKLGTWVKPNDDGSIIVTVTELEKPDREYRLEKEEFEVEYDKGNIMYDVAIQGATIVALDLNLTDELRLEGDARDLIRYIQEARKEADYNMDDRIILSVSLPHDIEKAADMPYKSDIQTLLNQFGELVTGETLATLVEVIDAPDVQQTVLLEMVGNISFRIKKQ